MNLLEHLVRANPDVAPVPSLAAWLDRLDLSPFAASIDRATWAGFESDRLGYAFIGGYQAALAQLLGDSSPAPRPRRSLAATEAGGAHPRAVETTLGRSGDAMTLSGVKTFATLASVATELLVVASAGKSADGKNTLVVVRVRPDAPNVTIEERAPTPFAPEIPHAKVTLADVAVREADILPGDGYTAYLRPFRTIEDAHVLAASLGLLFRTARAHAFTSGIAERALALIAALRAIGAVGPSDPSGHLALAGAFEEARLLIASSDADWETKTEAVVRDRWRRDLALLLVAETARRKRTEAAWAVSAYSGRP